MSETKNSSPTGIQLNNMVCYWETGRVGTGSAETIKHGLGKIPKIVLIVLRDTIGAANQYTLGTLTNADIPVTVTNAAVYDVLAFVSQT